MKASDFIEKLLKICNSYKTLYVKGCFGSPLNDANKKRYTKNNVYNASTARKKLINASDCKTYGFDCVNLIKGVLWGWTGNITETYGGAKYASNNVPDVNADKMITLCSGVSTDFKNIVPGEVVYIPGHIGIYIGDGNVVECTPKWTNNVQISRLANNDYTDGNSRKWDKHGKLPWIEYDGAKKTESVTRNSKPAVASSAPNIKKGSKGNAAKLLQIDLNYCISIGNVKGTALVEDGSFGVKSVEMLKSWQTANGLKADGVYGKTSRSVMESIICNS